MNPEITARRYQIINLVKTTQVPKNMGKLVDGEARCLISLVGENLMGLPVPPDMEGHDVYYRQVADWCGVHSVELWGSSDDSDTWGDLVPRLYALFELPGADYALE